METTVKLLSPDKYFDQLKDWNGHTPTGISDYATHTLYNKQQFKYYFNLLQRQLKGIEDTGFTGMIVSDANWVTFERSNHCDITLNGMTATMMNELIPEYPQKPSTWRANPPSFVKYIYRKKGMC